MSIGNNIAAARKAKHLTQDQLAEKLNVSFQAVSAWERDEYLPETKKLTALADTLSLSIDAMLDEEPRSWDLQSPNFDADRMYTYVKAKAQGLGLQQTLAALPFMREKHDGQYRKGMVSIDPYRVHPLMLACHALAMGISDDDVLAALLLHDVVEDAEPTVMPEDLPANKRVQEAVRLVSHNTYPYDEKKPGDLERIWPEYYGNISKNPLAALVKCMDRCNNLSCMADGFKRTKMKKYIQETEEYIVPLLDVIKAVPDWNNAAWLLRYQMHTLLEVYKRML